MTSKDKMKQERIEKKIKEKIKLYQSHLNLQVPFIDKDNSEWTAKEIEIWNTTKSVLICRNLIQELEELKTSLRGEK